MSKRIAFATAPQWLKDTIKESGRAGESYEWSEAQCMAAYEWYMTQRISKSRASKALRALAIMFAVIGAIIPFFALASRDSVNSDWGFLALALAAGSMLADRAFGFSTSWIRYLQAGLALQALILETRASMLRLIADESDNRAGAIHGEILELSSKVTIETDRIIAQETSEWVEEFKGSLQELGRKTST